MKPFSHRLQWYRKLWILIWVFSWLGCSKTFSQVWHLVSSSEKFLFSGRVLRNLLSTPVGSFLLWDFLFPGLSWFCSQFSFLSGLFFIMPFFSFFELFSMSFFFIFASKLTFFEDFLLGLIPVFWCSFWMCPWIFFMQQCVNEHSEQMYNWDTRSEKSIKHGKWERLNRLTPDKLWPVTDLTPFSDPSLLRCPLSFQPGLRPRPPKPTSSHRCHIYRHHLQCDLLGVFLQVGEPTCAEWCLPRCWSEL